MRAELEEKLRQFDFDGAEGAADKDVVEVEEALGKELPQDLRDILIASDGLELKSDFHRLAIWSCREILDYNRANKVQTRRRNL